MSYETSDMYMQSFQNAVARAISIGGPNILENKYLFLNVIEDLVPYHESDYKFLKKTFDMDLGSMLKDAYKSGGQEEQYLKDILNYLLDEVGLSEKKAIQFMGYFAFLKDKSNQSTHWAQNSSDRYKTSTSNSLSDNRDSANIIEKIEDDLEKGNVATAVKTFENEEQLLMSSEAYSYICLLIGESLEKSDPKKAIIYLSKSAAKGNSRAMFLLGYMYENGEGTIIDLNKAASYYKSAADIGNRGAQHNLGCFYYYGNGVNKDYKIAFEYFFKAAQQGKADSMKNIGVMYELGQYVAQNYEKALEWYNKARENGDCDADEYYRILDKKLLKSELNNRIIMIGIGGAGNNTINRAINEQINGIEYVAINADKNALQLCNASKHILAGEKSFKGIGTAANPELGKKAAEESAELIREAIKGAAIVFICCGMGGGMGTGGAPVVARIAKEMGILTVGIVTKPFRFEAQIRKTNAMSGIECLKKFVDTLIVIPNDIILEVVDRNTTMADALGRLDKMVFQGMQGIRNFVESNTKNNMSLAELSNIIKGKGLAHVGYSTAKGKGKIISALQMAIASPWLENSIKNATQVLLYLHGDILELDVSYVVRHIQEVTGLSDVVYSVRCDESMSDEVEVIIITYDGTEKLNNEENVNKDKTLQGKRRLFIPDFLKRSSIKKEQIPTIPDSLKRK